MKLNIYLITRADNTGYDEYDSAVVVAENEIEAQATHPNGYARLIKGKWTTPEDGVEVWLDWCLPANVRVKLITAYTGSEFKAGDVICASYHAG